MIDLEPPGLKERVHPLRSIRSMYFFTFAGDGGRESYILSGAEPKYFGAHCDCPPTDIAPPSALVSGRTTSAGFAESQTIAGGVSPETRGVGSAGSVLFFACFAVDLVDWLARSSLRLRRVVGDILLGGLAAMGSAGAVATTVRACAEQ